MLNMLSKLHESGKYTVILVLALFASLVVSFCGADVQHMFLFDRNSINDGELWRIFTGHFVHIGAGHWVMNAAGAGLLWWLLNEVRTGIFWISSILLISAAISAGLLIGNPRLEWYGGFSGVLHGLVVVGIISGLSGNKKVLLAMLLLVSVKLMYEQIYVPIQYVEGLILAPVIVDAHLYGALSGIGLGLFDLWRRNYYRRKLLV